MTKSRSEINKDYWKKIKENPEQYEDLKRRNKFAAAKSFIRIHATDKEMKELKLLINDRIHPWSTINTKREKH